MHDEERRGGGRRLGSGQGWQLPAMRVWAAGTAVPLPAPSLILGSVTWGSWMLRMLIIAL